MNSLFSFFASKKYETQADLKDLSPEQILRLDFSDIGNNIETRDGGIPLSGVKKRALFNLLSQKRMGNMNQLAREKIINNFLIREGLENDAETNQVINNAINSVANQEQDLDEEYYNYEDNEFEAPAPAPAPVVKSAKKTMDDQIREKDMTNRLRRLRDQPPIPYTEDEEFYLRYKHLSGGKKSRRNRNCKLKKRKLNKKRTKKRKQKYNK